MKAKLKTIVVSCLGLALTFFGLFVIGSAHAQSTGKIADIVLALVGTILLAIGMYVYFSKADMWPPKNTKQL